MPLRRRAFDVILYKNDKGSAAMTTEKLYYADSHIFEFSARVLECLKLGEGFAAVLDRTAFFPEGGGQSGDTGYIGAARVTDTHERNGRLLHYCAAPLEPGAEYLCRLDAEQRLRRMQNHSGEHIFSGLVHRLHGFDNVGFHMGAECMTIDFSGEPDEGQLEHIETLANVAVRADIPVRTFFPEPGELTAMEYRSKLELTENVRIVEIEGIDRCACCAPHVSSTGEIGAIKLLDVQRHRGGVRLSLVCGMDALEDYRRKQEAVVAVSRALSAKRHETAAAVERLLAEQQRLRERTALLSMELVRLRADGIGGTEGNICVFEPLLDEPAQRELANLLAEKCGGFAAVFCGGEALWRYVICSRHTDLRARSRELNALMDGKGGGSAQMLMGSAHADRQIIQNRIKNARV